MLDFGQKNLYMIDTDNLRIPFEKFSTDCAITLHYVPKIVVQLNNGQISEHKSRRLMNCNSYLDVYELSLILLETLAKIHGLNLNTNFISAKILLFNDKHKML